MRPDPVAILRYYFRGRRQFVNFDLIDGRLVVCPGSVSKAFKGVFEGVRLRILDRPKVYTPFPEPVTAALGLPFPSWIVIPSCGLAAPSVYSIVARGKLVFRTTACIYSVALTWHEVYGRVVALDNAHEVVLPDQIGEYVASGFSTLPPKYRGEFVEGSIVVECDRETTEEKLSVLETAGYTVLSKRLACG